jgi:hypothetical protein
MPDTILEGDHPSPFFLFLAWRPSLLEVGITGHVFGRGPSKEHSTKVWLQLAQWFLKRKLKCEMLTDGRRTTDDGFYYLYFVCLGDHIVAVSVRPGQLGNLSYA